jgi:ribosomal protein L11 methyltransferase
VLDVGCGSGILSLTALKLGAAFARAVDVDPDAVAVTRENAERNGLSQLLEVDATPAPALAERYPVVVANIECSTLVDLAGALCARLEPGGLLVLSGILAPPVAPSQLERIRDAYRALGEDRVLTRGEWIAVVLRDRAAHAAQ